MAFFQLSLGLVLVRYDWCVIDLGFGKTSPHEWLPKAMIHFFPGLDQAPFAVTCEECPPADLEKGPTKEEIEDCRGDSPSWSNSREP